MPESVKKFYEFGEFRLDPAERLLLRGDEPIHLQARAFDTLLALVQNNGHLIEKDELLKTVWADSFVEENNLTQNIYALRKVFAGEKYIETVPRHGYRFTGEVREIFEETGQMLIENRSILRVKLEEIEETSVGYFDFSRKAIIAAAGLLVLLLTGGFLVWQSGVRNESKSIIVSSEIKTLAVLPFQIENPTNADEFLGLVIADDLSRQIRNSQSFKFRFITPGSRVLENNADAQTLGKLLKADAVLTGNVRKYGEFYEIEIRLLKTNDGAILWQKNFANGTIYQINDAVSADFLKDYPSANPNNTNFKKHRPENLEAYKNYIKARALWNKRTSAELHQATILLEQTVAKNPNFALAYAALADAYAFDYTQRFKAVETAQKALELDADSGEAHATLGFAYLFWDWKVIEAEYHFKQSAALSPQYATGHQWYAALFAASGMMSAAKEEIQTALELEPASLPINADAGQILYFADEYDKAFEQCSAALTLDADFINAYGCLYQIYTKKEMYQEAVSAYFKREEIAKIERKNVTDRNAKLKQAFENKGIQGFWGEMLLPLWEDQGYLSRAEYHARLGNREEALQLLEIGFEKREFGFLFIAVNPIFESYRSEPRFKRFIQAFSLVAQKK